MIGINEIIQQSWDISAEFEDINDKIHCLASTKEAYGMKLDLLTNAALIEDAGRFIQEKKKELEQQQSLSLQRQPMKQPPQETKQEQQQEQEPETFNKTF